MFLDGLEDAYDKGKLMGVFAEQCADKFQFSREAQDEFAMRVAVAGAGREQRWLVQLGDRAGHRQRAARVSRSSTRTSSREGEPGKIPGLKPAFRKDGTVTAANSSSISDGAAALVLMRRSLAEEKGFQPLAIILDHATHAQEPGWFTTAPGRGDAEALRQARWTPKRSSTCTRSTKRSRW